MNEFENSVTKVLRRLGDSAGEVWSRAEVRLYLKDGYDTLCRQTKCLFDMAYIENLPAVGSHSSDEEFELAKLIPNLLLADRRTFTREVDRDFSEAGAVGPAGVTNYADIAFLSTVGVLSRPSPVGQLPRSFVDIWQVLHDRVTLTPERSFGMSRYVDNRYQEQTGDPSWFTVDKDGLFALRRYPGGDGEAAYVAVTGWWGVEVSDSDFTGTVIGSWGAMTYDPEEFPIGGPWGTPTRTHPDDNNTRVEISRLGRDPESYGFEVPPNYVKTIEFWACARALKRDGPGQSAKMANHYFARFEVGVSRLTRKTNSVQSEYVGRIGFGRATVARMSIGLPYSYGVPRRRSGRY